MRKRSRRFRKPKKRVASEYREGRDRRLYGRMVLLVPQPFEDRYSNGAKLQSIIIEIPVHVYDMLNKVRRITRVSIPKQLYVSMMLFLLMPRPCRSISSLEKKPVEFRGAAARLLRRVEEHTMMLPSEILTAAVEDFMWNNKELIDAQVRDWSKYVRPFSR